MTAPIWITPAGDLGTIPDQEFYQLTLNSAEPNPIKNFAGSVSVTTESKVVTGVGTKFLTDLAVNDILLTESGGFIGAVKVIHSDTHLDLVMDSSNTLLNVPLRCIKPIRYDIIAGKLPVGLHLDQFGSVMGVPINGEIEGVPAAIYKVITSTFTVRAKNSQGEVSDRTFSLTVAGVNPPQIVPKDASLGTFFDGDFLSVQLNAVDFVADTSLTWTVVDGSLPPGVTLSKSGLLQGFIEPATPSEGANQGFDASQFDRYTFDFFGVNISKNYQFKVMAYDGYTSDTSSYTVYVYNKSSMTADNDKITSDNVSVVDASIDKKHTPIIRNLDLTLAPIRQGGYYVYKFDGYDFDGDEITYSYTGNLPDGLTLNTQTGWVTGVIPLGSLGAVNYTFTVKVHKTSYPNYYSEKEFILPLMGQVNNTATWVTPSFVGTIDNGAISTFNISATTPSGKSLQYKILYQDPYDEKFAGSKLPQGLELLPDGNIVGRVNFETFTLDGNTTTFDKNATTYDREFGFTVETYDSDNYVSSKQRFTIKVAHTNKIPYENLYIKALPSRDERVIYDQIINNSDIFPPQDIYRFSDPWFGKNTNLVSLFLTGIAPHTAADYVSAMTLNHYWKKITFGNVKTAQALDENFNVKYEVVYVELVDNSVNEQGESPSANIAIRTNSTNITNVYPNSFKNMGDQIINNLGYANKSILPEWMTSRQKDGRVLGFTRALVLCYALPGKSDAIAYRVNQRINDLRLVDFTIDRYEWDRSLSQYFSLSNQAFISYNTASGNISFSTTSSTVIGTGTNFLGELAVGQILVNNGESVIGRIQQITSNNELILFANAALTESNIGFKHSVGETVFDREVDRTTFDYNQTRFYEDQILYQDPSFGTQYLKYPNVTITTNSLSS